MNDVTTQTYLEELPTVRVKLPKGLWMYGYVDVCICGYRLARLELLLVLISAGAERRGGAHRAESGAQAHCLDYETEHRLSGNNTNAITVKEDLT